MVNAMRIYSVKILCFETNSLGDQHILLLLEVVQGIGLTGKTLIRIDPHYKCYSLLESSPLAQSLLFQEFSE
jgi:hypothetical protein